MSLTYVAPHNGTPIPGANPEGYMLGPTEGTYTWLEKALITFKTKAADTEGNYPSSGVTCRKAGRRRYTDTPTKVSCSLSPKNATTQCTRRRPAAPSGFLRTQNTYLRHL